MEILGVRLPSGPPFIPIRPRLAGAGLFFVAALRGCVPGIEPSCAAAELGPRAEAWPAADGLFRGDPRWLGGDAAYSVDLGRARVLWLFGDSFIARSAAGLRREAVMIHNSVAVQEGLDPSSATIRFYWGGSPGAPDALLPAASAEGWLWPLDGVRLGEGLLLFVMRVRATPGGGVFGFEATGWEALRVENPDDAPPRWRVRRIGASPKGSVAPEAAETPRARSAPRPAGRLIIGASVLREGRYLYAFGVTEPRHDVVVLRWEVRDAERGDLSGPQGWEGPRTGWVALHDADTASLTRVFPDGQTEFSVHYDPRLERFVEVQSQGFGGTDISIRTAGRLEGPWTPLAKVYRPPESERPGVLVYAAKAHPELSCGEDVFRSRGGCGFLVTYATNASDVKALAADATLYYPRFVRIAVVGCLAPFTSGCRGLGPCRSR